MSKLTVYVLTDHVDYEGDTVIGVYPDVLAAQMAATKILSQQAKERKQFDQEYNLKHEAGYYKIHAEEKRVWASFCGQEYLITPYVVDYQHVPFPQP